MSDGRSRRIGQLIRLLSSDKPGEVGAAAAALTRALESAGLDIHDLAAVAETGLPIHEPVQRPKPAALPPDARRPDGRAMTMMEILICDQPSGLFRACACGSILFVIAPGVGPHVAQLVCDACGARGRWLSRRLFQGAS